MRLAWFAPMPPDDGLAAADPSAVVLPHLAERHQIDVFAASDAHALAWRDWSVAVRGAHDFVWRHHLAPFDLVVHHLSNQPCHDYIWGYLWSYPGLVVLHDVRLHHARARILLDRRDPRLDDYGAELSYSSGLNPDIRRALGFVTGPTLQLWPMRAAAVASARSVAVHDGKLVDEVKAESPEVAVEIVRVGAADPGPQAELRTSPAAREIRQRHRIPPDAVVLAVFGPLTRSQRVAQIVIAFAAARQFESALHLLLAGPVQADYDAMADVRMKGLSEHVTITGPVPERELPPYLGAADVALCLSWPSDGNASPMWVRCLASGLPTVITALGHQTNVPVIEPVSWEVSQETAEPIAVSIDLLQEQQALRSAFRQLAVDSALRDRLGRAGRAWWAVQHTPRLMADDYDAAIQRAAGRPAPATALPLHLRPDVFEHARALIRAAAVEVPSDLMC